MTAYIDSLCSVIATVPPSMDVNVAAGTGLLNVTPVTISANSTLSVGSSDAPSHYVAVVSDISGTALAISMDDFAATPTAYIPIALVYVEANITAIIDSAIQDRRPTIQAPAGYPSTITYTYGTIDPHIAGKMWSNSGILTVSSG